MDILEALAALDVSNDEQWTTDGLPKVDAVASLVGNDKLKRSDILEASPDFNRDVAKAAVESDVIVLKNQSGTVITGDEEVAGPTPNYGDDAEEVKDVEARDETSREEKETAPKECEASQDQVEPKPLIDQLQDAFNEANTELNEVSKQAAILTEQRKVLESKTSYLGGQLDRVKKATGAEQSAIQAYLRTNARIKQEKAAVRQKLIDSGLTEVLKAVAPTPLDVALKQRKPLPSNVRREYPRAINSD